RVAKAAAGAAAARLALELEAPVRARAIDELRRAFRAEGGPQTRRSAKHPGAWPLPWRERLEEKVAADLNTAVRAELEVLLLRKGGRAVSALAAAEALWAKEERLRSSVY